MKKNKKTIVLLCMSLTFLTFISIANISASSEWFYLDAPKFQRFDYSDVDNGDGIISDTKSSTAIIGLEYCNAEAVTFYVGEKISNAKYDYATKGAVIYCNENLIGTANYKKTYSKGTEMGFKVRNHNWTNVTRKVNGTINYH